MTQVSSAQLPGAPAGARRAAAGSFVGAVVEWYDFLLYGVVAALVFPNHDGHHTRLPKSQVRAPYRTGETPDDRAPRRNRHAATVRT